MKYRQGGVVEVHRPVESDPKNKWQPIFLILGGAVLVKAIRGIRKEKQVGGVSRMQLRHSVGPTLLSEALPITGDPADTLYLWFDKRRRKLRLGGLVKIHSEHGSIALNTNSGLIIIPPLISTDEASVMLIHGSMGVVMGKGLIEMTMTSLVGSGSTQFSIFYLPLSPGATIAAV